MSNTDTEKGGARALSSESTDAHSGTPATGAFYSPPDPASLNQSNFAGRLGASQQYTVSATAASSEAFKREHPDAIRDASWSLILSPYGFRDRRLWRMAFIEGVGTCLQTAIGAFLGIGLVPTAPETSVGPVFPVALASLAQVFLISLFVYAMAPLTGGHLNPLITLGTFACR